MAKAVRKDLVIGSQGLRGFDSVALSGVTEQGSAALETRLTDDEINNLITRKVEN